MADRIGIVGAGICGLAAAAELAAAGREVAVFDKSRGIGGRLATRRVDAMSFDHGAPAAHGEAAFLDWLTTLGAGVGLGANALLARHGIGFGSKFTYGGMVFDTMRSEINARSFLIPAVTVLFAAVIVCLIPAVKASRTEPARTMRMH